MRLRLIAPLLAAASTCFGNRLDPRRGRGWCGTPEPGTSLLQTLSGLRHMEAGVKNGTLEPRAKSDYGPIPIQTYVYIVSSEEKRDEITPHRVDFQIKVLQSSYKDHYFTFNIREINRIVDDNLSKGPFSHEETFVKFLNETRKGPYSSLNLYFYTDYPDSQFGLCTLPEPGLTTASRNRFFDDGCHINSGTMPLGHIEDYNLGYTVVHEVGHWLGLLHTFNGYSCGGDGDLVDDTPPQSEDTVGCPTRKDSCPDQLGEDMIHNYMDYSSDPCYREFTRGQRNRMHDSYLLYRVHGRYRDGKWHMWPWGVTKGNPDIYNSE